MARHLSALLSSTTLSSSSSSRANRARVPTGEFACACGNFCHRNEAGRSVGSEFSVGYQVCDRHTVSGNRKPLTLLHAAHDRAAVVSQFPLTQRCGHNANRSTKVLRAM